MKSKSKCPICKNNLHKINIVVSTCTNDKCKLWGSSIPNLVLDALAQARLDLEIATKALDWLGNNRLAENPVRVEQLRRYARNTLEQITHDTSGKANSAEHKDIK